MLHSNLQLYKKSTGLKPYPLLLVFTVSLCINSQIQMRRDFILNLLLQSMVEFYLRSVASKYGRSHTVSRVRYPVHYNRSEKTLMLYWQQSQVAPDYLLVLMVAQRTQCGGSTFRNSNATNSYSEISQMNYQLIQKHPPRSAMLIKNVHFMG